LDHSHKKHEGITNNKCQEKRDEEGCVVANLSPVSEVPKLMRAVKQDRDFEE
jgi:hypothetical protein